MSISGSHRPSHLKAHFDRTGYLGQFYCCTRIKWSNLPYSYIFPFIFKSYVFWIRLLISMGLGKFRNNLNVHAVLRNSSFVEFKRECLLQAGKTAQRVKVLPYKFTAWIQLLNQHGGRREATLTSLQACVHTCTYSMHALVLTHTHVHTCAHTHMDTHMHTAHTHRHVHTHIIFI